MAEQIEQQERERSTSPVVKMAIERKLITPEQHEECKTLLKKSRKIGLESTIEEILVKQKYLSEETLAELVELSEIGEDGTLFGGYRLVAQLGQGGMGKVYSALHEFMNRPVAVKVIHYAIVRDDNARTRFFQEIRALAKLNHPNIITIYDAGKVKRRYYYSMELVKGNSLASIVEEQGPLNEKRCLEVIRDIARALSHAHARNIVHRDVKPENILIDENNIPKLSDFGIVMHFDDDHMTLTQEGHMVGTLHYVSPEQAEGGRDIDGRSDIYSLGATLYFALTKRTVYKGKQPHEIIVQHLSGNWISPRRYNHAISRKTVKILRKMMARNRDKRFQTMDSVIKAIEKHSLFRESFFRPRNILIAAGAFLAGAAAEFSLRFIDLLQSFSK